MFICILIILNIVFVCFQLIIGDGLQSIQNLGFILRDYNNNKVLPFIIRSTKNSIRQAIFCNSLRKNDLKVLKLSDIDTFIGIESHIQLNTKSKIFCDCLSDNSFTSPNYNICPICIGEPGALPSINQEAINLAILAASYLNCSIADTLNLDRKLYYFLDLPKNYQITQNKNPLGKNGQLSTAYGFIYPIQKVHMEEDSAKSIHNTHEDLIDFNRAGIPLLEITTEPILISPQEASDYLKELINLFRNLNISDCKMETGQFRCDINISIRSKNNMLAHPKVELKNLNSLKAIREASKYEITRQFQVLKSGDLGNLISESRYWNITSKKTYKIRNKEFHEDYLHTPEFDIPSISLNTEVLERKKYELPSVKSQRFHNTYLIPLKQTNLLCENAEISNYFEEAVKLGAPPLESSNWILNDLRESMLKSYEDNEKFSFSPKKLTEVIQLIKTGEINHQSANTLFKLSLKFPETNLNELIIKNDLKKISNKETIISTIYNVLKDSEQQLTAYRNGKIKLYRYFLAQTLKRMNFRADTAITSDLLKDILDQN